MIDDLYLGNDPLDQALSAALAPVIAQFQGGKTITAPPVDPASAPAAPADPKKDPDKVFNALVDSISGQESGGNYSAKNKRTGAAGKYQIIPSNIGPWTQEITGKSVSPQQFLSSPDLQEKVARAKLGEYYNEALSSTKDPVTAAQLAANKWYTGKFYSGDKRPASNEPTPGEYRSSITNRLLSRLDGSNADNSWRTVPAQKAAVETASFASSLDDAKKSAPYGLVVVGADGSFLDFKGNKLSVQPKAQPKADKSSEDFGSYLDNIKAGLPPEPNPIDRFNAINEKVGAAKAEFDAYDPHNPKSPLSRMMQEAKANDLVLSGQAPSMDVARSLLQNMSASSYAASVDPQTQQQNQNKIQDESLSAISKAIGSKTPGGFLAYFASKSDVAKTITNIGAEVANTFNIASSIDPKAFEAVKRLTTPQSTTGKTVAEFGGGALKSLAELAILHKTLAPGTENMTAAESGATLFGTQALVSNVAPVLSGQKNPDEVLKEAVEGAVVGGIFPGVTNATKSVAENALQSAPASLARLGNAAAEGIGAAGIGIAQSELDAAVNNQSLSDADRTKAAVNLGLFGAVTGFIGGARSPEATQQVVEQKAAAIPEIDISKINEPMTPSPQAATPAPEAKPKSAKKSAKTEEPAPANPLEGTPHEPTKPGKFVTDEPLTEEPYTSKKKDYAGKTRTGVWVDDPNGDIGKSIVGIGLLHKEGKSFIPEKNIARPEGFVENKIEEPATKDESRVLINEEPIVAPEPESVTSVPEVASAPEQQSTESAGALPADEKQSIDNKLEAQGVSIRESKVSKIYDYAIRNRIPTKDADGNKIGFIKMVKTIQEIEYAKAEAAKPAEPSDMQTSGTLSMHVIPGAEQVAEQVSEVYNKDIKPKIDTAVKGIGEVAGAIHKGITPGSVGSGKITSQVLREKLGMGALSNERAHAAFESAKSLFDSSSQADNFKFIADVQSGQPTGNEGLDKVASSVRGFLDADRELIQSVKPDALKEFDANYFPQLWKDPNRASKLLRAMGRISDDPQASLLAAAMDKTDTNIDKRKFLKDVEAGRTFDDPVKQKLADDIRAYAAENPDVPIAAFGAHRPFAGKKGFLKQKTYATFAEGLEAGLEPVSNNPIEMVLAHHAQVVKYVAAHQTMNELKTIKGMMVFTRDNEAPPPGYARINDSIGTVTYKNKEGKFEHGGYWNVPEDGARVINNYLSPGLWNQNWYRTLRGTGNMMNQFQLGLSAFHAHFAALDAITSEVSLAVKQLVNRDYLLGVKTLIASPTSPVTNMSIAKKLKTELLNPGTHPEMAALAEAYKMSGLRLGMDPAYRTNMRQQLKEVWRQPNSLLRSVLRVPGAAMEASMSPILEKLVPNLKIGAFAKIAEYELSKLGPEATHEQKRLAFQKIGESVENRLGQIAYDNLHWNRTAKDIFMVSVRSVGWNFGSIREGIGGAMDWGRFVAKAGGERKFTDRMAYTIALPVTVGIYGAVLQALFTAVNGGTPEFPSTESVGSFLKDLYFPRTGETTEQGAPKRISLPSYMKDVAHLAQSVLDRSPREVLEMGTSKLHPFWGWLAESINNRDFYNTQIWNGEDNAWKIGADILSHFSTTFTPFSIRGWMKSAELDEPIGNRALQLVGLPPAPASLNETPAERKMYGIIRGQLPQGTQRVGAFERHRTMNLIERQIRLGNGARASAMKSEAILSGTIARADLVKIDRDAKTDHKTANFKRLSNLDALAVMEEANAEEQPKFLKVLRDKAANLQRDRFSEDDWTLLAERFGKYGIKLGGGLKLKASHGFGSGFSKGFGSGF